MLAAREEREPLRRDGDVAEIARRSDDQTFDGDIRRRVALDRLPHGGRGRLGTGRSRPTDSGQMVEAATDQARAPSNLRRSLEEPRLARRRQALLDRADDSGVRRDGPAKARRKAADHAASASCHGRAERDVRRRSTQGSAEPVERYASRARAPAVSRARAGRQAGACRPRRASRRRDGRRSRLATASSPAVPEAAVGLSSIQREVGTVLDVCGEPELEALVAARLTGNDQRPDREHEPVERPEREPAEAVLESEPIPLAKRGRSRQASGATTARSTPCSSQARRRTSPTPSAWRSRAICSAAALSPDDADRRRTEPIGGHRRRDPVRGCDGGRRRHGRNHRGPSTSRPCRREHVERLRDCASVAGTPILATICSSVREPSSSGSSAGKQSAHRAALEDDDRPAVLEQEPVAVLDEAVPRRKPGQKPARGRAQSRPATAAATAAAATHRQHRERPGRPTLDRRP